MVDFFIDSHAGETFDVVEQTFMVSPEAAGLIMACAKANAAALKAY